jgi:methionine aminotransferase
VLHVHDFYHEEVNGHLCLLVIDAENGVDADVAQVVSELGVAAIPITAFYVDPDAPQLARFCFAKKDETMRAAGERLRNLHTIAWR